MRPTTANRKMECVKSALVYMTDILNDSTSNRKKEPTVVYRQVEKETILVEQVFNFLFQTLDEEDKLTE